MASIFGDGGIRRAPEPTSGPPADALARAGELARRLATIVDEASPEGPLEAARLLVEVRRLAPQVHEGFLAAAAANAAPEARAETVRERIARAYPEGSDRRRKLAAALVSLEGGQPETLPASLLEAKVTSALGKLGTAVSAVRGVSADTMEKSRGIGLFGGNPAPSASAPAASTGPEVSAATVWQVHSLQQQAAAVASIVSTAAPDAFGAVPGAWDGVLARAQEVAPGLTGGIASLGRADGALSAVRRGLARIDEGKGFWARARTAASVDAMDRIAARLEGMRDRLGGGLEAAASGAGRPPVQNLAGVARELHGEAVEVRGEIGRAWELVPDIELGEAASAQNALGSAEEHMQAAEYGLQAYATQQDLVSSQAPEGVASGAEAPAGESSSPALTPEMITPEVIEQLRASGQVPPEVIAQLEAGEITPELLARLESGTGARISRAGLESIGTEISGTPAQGFWNIGTVGGGMDRAIFDSDDYTQKAAAATNRALSGSAVRPIDGAELAAAIRDTGVPLTKVDPSQLQAAVDYINKGSAGAVAEFGRGAPRNAEEQRERMALALRQTRYLVEHGAAPLDRQTAIGLCWSAARIPGHAFEGMSDDEARAVAQQTAVACNTPGNHEFKVGKHTVSLTIGDDGTVKKTSTRPPSFWSKVGQVAKVALTVASFVPGPVGLVARGVQAGISLVNTIRNGGGFLEIVSAGASFVGAAASAIGGMSKATSVIRIANTVAGVANSVAGVARGVQGIRRGGVGNFISGVGGIVNGIGGGIQAAGGSSAAGSVSNAFSDAGRVLGQVGAAVGGAENYVHANREVRAAREAVEQAQASGDPAKIRRAEQQLVEAERAKRSAILGGLATAGQIAANTLSRNPQGQTDSRTGQVPAQGRSPFQVGAEVFSRGMNVARGINDRDYFAAGVEALGAAAAARQGTKAIAEEYIIRDGKRIRVFDSDGQPIPGEYLKRDDFNFLNQASSVLDGLNDWRGAERGERQARDAVNRAKAFLDQAMASGDPEAIHEAEEGLRRARQEFVRAELGTASALDNAAQRFTGAVDTLKNSRAADGYREERREALATTFATLTADAAALASRMGPGTEVGEGAAAELYRLRAAMEAYDRALQNAHGDPEKIEAATNAFLAEQVRIASRLDRLERLAPPLRYADGPGAPPLDVRMQPAYQKDVHYEQTFDIAQWVGFSLEEAARIAGGDQGVDDNWGTSPFWSGRARREFHFTTPEQRARLRDRAYSILYDKEYSADRLDRALVAFGQYLHALQDSYSHQRGMTDRDGKPYLPEPGHIWTTAPDIPRNRPELWRRMTNETTRELHAFYKAFNKHRYQVVP